MRPRVDELLERIAERLRTEIAPLLADDPWPASELRSIDTLLAHLVARVRHEHDVLVADNADLRELFTDLAGSPAPEVAVRAIAAGREAANATARTSSPQGLEDANLAAHRALEEIIHLLHAANEEAGIASVRAYLARAAERERLLYGPFLGRPHF